ncbi:tetratricopeptide repeat protein [Planomicrobium okeanokoites]|uniref:tetratricopeptide repeat protein n=1 Tax=Planomicrobium okeanokoites TaxID=244 RepID=UPI00248FE34C|nr:SEC-C metal-binding domain-containing protein [Planomicrobium okeanokoites]
MTNLHDGKPAVIGRNEACICGSGKKYKKCCGINDSEKFIQLEQNKGLQEILQEFFSTHPRPSQQKGLLDWKNKTEDLLVPLYGEEKSGGIIGDIYFFSEHADIWNNYIDSKIEQERRLQISNIINAWKNPAFLAGEVLSITNYRAIMRDLLSQKEYEIDVNESFAVEEGNIAMGFYLPDVRINNRYLMVLNSVTISADVNTETVEKLKNMFNSSSEKDEQLFYKKNIITIYQMFSSGLRSVHEVPQEILKSVQQLEQFMIDQDLKSDDLIETFFHYLQPLAEVPAAAIGGAIKFGMNQKLIHFDWTLDKLANEFAVDQKEIESFADKLQTFYLETMAQQDKEAEYAFEVGTNPKANELQNWQLFMHLKHAAISSEAALKRQMEYYHAKPYEPKSDSEKAQLLAYRLFEKGIDFVLPEELAALQQYNPQLPDGFLLAAEMEMDSAAKKSLLEKAISSGKLNYEPEMEVSWLYIANRPYLRAVFLLGIHYWENGEYESAFDQFQRLLQLNPADHQGARYLAVSSLIVLDRLKEAESLVNHYEDDYSDNAFYTWFKWLIARRRNMHSQETQALYLQAIEQNPYVKKYIEKRNPAMPYPKKAVITPRSPEEAHLIWSFLAPGLLQ